MLTHAHAPWAVLWVCSVSMKMFLGCAAEGIQKVVSSIEHQSKIKQSVLILAMFLESNHKMVLRVTEKSLQDVSVCFWVPKVSWRRERGAEPSTTHGPISREEGKQRL